MKFLLAVAAALCAVQVLSARSLNKDSPALELDFLRLDKAEDQHSVVSDILEKMEALLAFVEVKIDEVTDGVEQATKIALDLVQAVADEQAARWTDTVKEWQSKAEAAGVDVKECLDHMASLAGEIQGLREDAAGCARKQFASVQSALSDVTSLRPVAQKLVADSSVVAQACLAESNPVTMTFCMLQKGPALAVRATRLFVDVTLLSGRVAARAAATGPLASLCTSRAAAGRGAAATKIIDSTVQCIRTKLGQ